MESKDPEGERPEPRIEVGADLEELENHTVQDWKTRPHTEKKPITRWVIGPILIVALVGLGYAFWLVWRMEPSQPKTSPLAVELSALKGEVQKMTPELERLKKELEELKIENKTTVEQIKGFQTQLASMAKKVETTMARKVEPVAAKKPEPTPPPPKKPEPVAAKKTEPPAPPKIPAPAAKKPTAKTFVYKVQPGENIYSLGRKFKVDPDDILRLNELPPKAVLQAGQLLTIQSGTSR
ncbi:MAG: LysM peptidoglycan-binding domain-containing protein [Deltaproteobacteria bacterium]|nr:LysM peptidoglycan-binding domain-containing protein [Deltaproteobacteria bacterium]